MVIVCLLIFIVSAFVAFVLYRKSHRTKNAKYNCIGAFLACIILLAGAELSVFNINYYTSHAYTPESLAQYMQDYKADDGTFMLPCDEEIDLLDINKDIKNIKIQLHSTSPLYTNVTVRLTDEANKFLFKTPTQTIYRDVSKSQTLNIHTAGVSESISITFTGNDGYINVSDISVNVNRSFNFSFTRFGVLVALLMLLYLFRPKSPLYEQRLTSPKTSTINLISGFIALQCIIIVITGTMNTAFWGISIDGDDFIVHSLPMAHHNQYDELAQAILDGKVYIDNNDVPQSLKDMPNPYDTTARQYAALEAGDKYGWDVAYYNGHYYVYFGIVPLLIMYLPCRLLFDAPFPSALGVLIFAMVFSIGVFMLLGLLCKKYFKKISVGTYLLLSMAFVNCCGAMFLVKRPDFYSVPIITGMSFVVFGIYLWLKGKDCEKRQNLYLAGGSLCCALAVGCRPQSVLICAVALPIFIGYFFKDGRIKQKRGILNLVVLGIPFIVVAAGIMYYNAIRFGSPFDFGSAYNLTTNDVTRRGFDIGRTGLGLFTYLFQPPQFTAVFPYLKAAKVETNYIGKTIAEHCFGGLITSLPILWFTFILPRVKDILKEKKLYAFTLTLLAIGVALVIADTQAGGLLQRYYSDFGFIFFMVAVIVIFSLYEKVKSKEGLRNLNTLVLTATILSIVYTISLVFSKADGTIDTVNPTLYGNIAHIVQFWL